MKEKNGTTIATNFRPVQPLNGRVVKTTFKPKVDPVKPNDSAATKIQAFSSILAVFVGVLALMSIAY